MQVNYGSHNVSFGRRMTQSELSDYVPTLSAAKNKAGQTGMSILIVHDTCLPQSDDVNTGIGHLSSKDSNHFFDFAKNYWGINTIEVLPQGQLTPVTTVAYGGTSLSLGDHEINPQLLTTDEYHNILKKEEFDAIVNSNKQTQKPGIVNYKNAALDGSPQDIAVRKAFKRFGALDEKTDLKQRFHNYVKENNDWMEPKCVYKILTKKNNSDYYGFWKDESEKNLYSLPEKEKKDKINEILASDKEEAEFFKFKQFIADEHLKKGKENLNKKGLKLKGDCLVGFSKDELWAHPEAFKKDCYIGLPSWQLPALNFDTITDKNSPSSQLLQRKIQLFAKRYDSIRFDVGWSYVQPVITPSGENGIQDKNKKYMGDSVLNIIEDTVRKEKGSNYNMKDLIWEVEAGPDTFNIFDGDKVIKPFQNRTKIYSSTYMHDYNGDKWGSNDAFLSRGWKPDEFVIGVGNHDPQPLRQIADNVPDKMKNPDGSYHVEYHKEPAVNALSKILNIPKEQLNNPTEFAKAKFAEPMMAYNNQMFYMDAFGRAENFDSHTHDSNKYSYKIGSDFVNDYMKSIKEGYGFNPMDSLEKVFRAKGWDKTDKELFDKIVKFKNILLEPEKISTSKYEENIKFKSKNKIIGVIIGGVALVAAGGVLVYKSVSDKKNNKLQILPGTSHMPIKNTSDVFSKMKNS